MKPDVGRRQFRRLILETMKEVAFEIHEKIVDRTPIDTGRAKASWRLNPDKADPTIEPILADRLFPSGAVREKASLDEHPLFSSQAEAVARAQQQKISLPEKIVISNNLDYITKLEEGTSDQAPEGMVKVTVTPGAVQSMFDRAIGKVSGPF